MHNYWSEIPFLAVSDDAVKWVVLEDTVRTRLLVVLQSYRPEEADITVDIGGSWTLTDVATGATIPMTDGTASVRMPADYGTRLFLAERAAN